MLVARVHALSMAAQLRPVGRSFKRDLALDLAVDQYAVRLLAPVRKPSLQSPTLCRLVY